MQLYASQVLLLDVLLFLLLFVLLAFVYCFYCHPFSLTHKKHYF